IRREDKGPFTTPEDVQAAGLHGRSFSAPPRMSLKFGIEARTLNRNKFSISTERLNTGRRDSRATALPTPNPQPITKPMRMIFSRSVFSGLLGMLAGSIIQTCPLFCLFTRFSDNRAFIFLWKSVQ